MKTKWASDDDRIRRLLIAVGRSAADDREILSLAESIDVAGLVAAARHHHVVSLVHDRLRAIPGAPSAVLDGLARPRLAAQAHRHLLQRTLVTALEALDVPAIVMKGHVLAEWYDQPLSRDFNDNDVLVHAADFGRAVAALEAVGLRATATNWHGFLEYGVGEVPVRHKSTVVDLHWHIVATGDVRRHFELSTSGFFERAIPGRVGDTSVLVLSPEDTLLHLCVNSGLGGGRRLRGLLDIDAVLRSGHVDPAAFVARSRSSCTERLCSAMLQRAHLLVGTPLPAGLLDELAPSRAWLLANRLAERVGGIRRRATAGIGPGLLLGSGRETALATLVAGGRALGDAVAVRRGRPDLTAPDGALAWGRAPEDGDIAGHRQRYFEWVATQA